LKERVLADQKGQQEPSMEEILASIRKIISEDDEAEKDNAETPKAPPGESAQSSQRADDGVLELTEMVESPAALRPVSAVIPSTPAAPKDEDSIAILAELEDSGELDQPEDDGHDASVESVMAAVRRMGTENDTDEVAAEAAEDEADAAIDLVDGGGPDLTDDPAPFAIEPDPRPDDPDDDWDNDRNIITDSAATAASAALAELAGALGENRPRTDAGAALSLGGSNRTVEDLVREMLRPMLREWLAANLPDLVQRLVRKEIKEMVRRSEDR
jgi:cell pole-organizing protein PopZ